MKAVQYHTNDDIRLVHLPIPAIRPGELLVQIAACGVCGSDTLEWYMRSRAPLFIGHEPAGTVVAVGAGVDSFQVGDRVFVHHHVPCGACYLCRHERETLCAQYRATHLDPSGMAEYVRVPAAIVAQDVLRLPAGMTWEQAAIVEPVACCVRGIKRLTLDAESVVIVAGGGFIGLVCLQLLRHAGVHQIAVIEPVAFRRQRAQELGATLVLGPQEAHLPNRLRDQFGRSATTAIITTSALEAIYQNLELLDIAATILLLAPPPKEQPATLDLARLFFQEWTMTASYGSGPADTRAALDLIDRGVVDAGRLITHRFPLEQAATAIAHTASPVDSLKCIVYVGEGKL